MRNTHPVEVKSLWLVRPYTTSKATVACITPGKQSTVQLETIVSSALSNERRRRDQEKTEIRYPIRARGDAVLLLYKPAVFPTEAIIL